MKWTLGFGQHWPFMHCWDHISTFNLKTIWEGNLSLEVTKLQFFKATRLDFYHASVLVCFIIRDLLDWISSWWHPTVVVLMASLPPKPTVQDQWILFDLIILRTLIQAGQVFKSYHSALIESEHLRQVWLDRQKWMWPKLPHLFSHQQRNCLLSSTECFLAYWAW